MDIIKKLIKYFKVGNIVPGYGGTLDKVLKFEHGKDIIFGWEVTVAECNKDGKIIGHIRKHATMPTSKELNG